MKSRSIVLYVTLLLATAMTSVLAETPVRLARLDGGEALVSYRLQRNVLIVATDTGNSSAVYKVSPRRNSILSVFEDEIGTTIGSGIEDDFSLILKGRNRALVPVQSETGLDLLEIDRDGLRDTVPAQINTDCLIAIHQLGNGVVTESNRSTNSDGESGASCDGRTRYFRVDDEGDKSRILENIASNVEARFTFNRIIRITGPTDVDEDGNGDFVVTVTNANSGRRRTVFNAEIAAAEIVDVRFARGATYVLARVAGDDTFSIFVTSGGTTTELATLADAVDARLVRIGRNDLYVTSANSADGVFELIAVSRADGSESILLEMEEGEGLDIDSVANVQAPYFVNRGENTFIFHGPLNDRTDRLYKVDF